MSSRIFHIAAVLCIITITAISYSNSLNGPFLLDDYSNIVSNSNLRMKDLSFSSIEKAATQGLLSKRWLPKLSFALNYYISGEKAVEGTSEYLKGEPYRNKVIGKEVDRQAKEFHLVNVIIHILAALFVYGMFLITLKSPTLKGTVWKEKEIALLAALLWAVHPIQTNAVTYIVQRMTSMSAMFTFFAFFLYGLARQPERKRLLWTLLIKKHMKSPDDLPASRR